MGQLTAFLRLSALFFRTAARALVRFEATFTFRFAMKFTLMQYLGQDNNGIAVGSRHSIAELRSYERGPGRDCDFRLPFGTMRHW